MAVTLSPNLKLRIDDDLTADAKFNLYTLDALGSVVSPTATGGSNIKSRGSILIQPNSADVGGTGVGGTVSVGESGVNISLFDIYAATVNFNNATVTNLSINANLVGDGSISNEEYGYLNGVTSNIQDQIDAIGGANQLVTTWTDADGPNKIITHGWGTRNVLVQVLDNDDDYSNIEVANISRPNSNQVVLDSSELPGGTWTILLAQIGT